MTERQPKFTESDIVALAATVEAPEWLHRRIQEMVAGAAPDGPGRSPARPRREPAPASSRLHWALPTRRLALAGAVALAGSIAVVLALTLPGGTRPGGSPALSARSAAALALGPATLPAPGESATNRRELTASVGGVAFPYWEERFGWRDSGARGDTLGGRAVTTVFYSNARGQRIGYAIVAGPAPAPAGGTLVRRWGVSYRLSSQDGTNVIVWRRGGHLCVVAGRGVSPGTLLSLASWGSERAHAA
jgi:hypothetical protein